MKEDLSEADCIICVKEVPEELLIANKTYLFFSHTIKAQRNNMAMLDAVLSKNIRLIDYERIIDPSTGQRLVRFGKYAGIAGMIDLFRALGNRLLFLKYSTPFLHLGYTHMYVNLDSAKQAVSAIGEEILLKGIPRDLSPMVFVFTGGDGNCSRVRIFLLSSHPPILLPSSFHCFPFFLPFFSVFPSPLPLFLHCLSLPHCLTLLSFFLTFNVSSSFLLPSQHWLSLLPPTSFFHCLPPSPSFLLCISLLPLSSLHCIDFPSSSHFLLLLAFPPPLPLSSLHCILSYQNCTELPFAVSFVQTKLFFLIFTPFNFFLPL